MKTTIAFLFALSLTGANALAQEEQNAQPNTSTVKASDVQKPDEQQKSELDEITNARMRAEAGSKSKWSVKANLNYQGGSVEKPFDRERPNYRATSSTQTVTSLSGTVAAAYRMTDKIAARFGTGVRMLTPFHNKDREVAQNHYENSDTRVMNVSTPYLEFSRAFRAGSLMHNPSLTYSHSTDQFDVDIVQSIGNLSFSHTIVGEFEGTGWQPGASVILDYTFYKDGAQDFDTIGNPNGRDDYNVGLYPFLEYAFNDTYSFRTVFGYFAYSHYRNDDAGRFQRLVSYQSVGVGISVTPEIYLYPNVQFIPDDARAERTNVALSTSLSVF